MDPLSVTLAVVSLTTAVKDLVELGQKIQESFARVNTKKFLPLNPTHNLSKMHRFPITFAALNA